MATNMDNVVFDEFSAYLPEQLLNLFGNLQDDSDVDSDDDSDDSVEENEEEVVSHKFLAVISPIDGAPGTLERRNEVNKRKQEFQHFLKAHYKDNADTIDKDIQGVSSFSEFEEKLGSFFKSLDAKTQATVFFLGHGSESGALCFNEGNMSCKEALTRIQTCFNDNKPKEMPAHQCRVVFAQCHAHHVDERNEPGVVHAAPGGIEYIYFTCDLKPKTHTRELDSGDTFLTLHHDLTDEDVYVRPPVTLEIIRTKLAALKRKIKDTLPEDYKRLKKRLAKYLLDGPPEHLQPDKCKEMINEARKNLSMFLQIVVQPNDSSGKPDFSIFDQHTDTKFTVKQKNVWSKAQFHEEVEGFMNGPAKDIILPVILVSGEYVEGEGSCNRKLVFSDQPGGVALNDIFHQYMISTETCSRRMLFMGRVKHSGNTVTPPFRNMELEENTATVLE